MNCIASGNNSNSLDRGCSQRLQIDALLVQMCLGSRPSTSHQQYDYARYNDGNKHRGHNDESVALQSQQQFK